MRDLWPAPTASGPVRAVVEVPGSKSVTNRALVLAALADGPCRIDHPLHARDTALMVEALRSLGTEISDDGADLLVKPGRLHGPARVDCGLAGTVMRFVPPVAALARGDVVFDGDPRARERPMGALLDALRQLGVAITDDGRPALPFTVHGSGMVDGGVVRIDASASSQVVSGLLLAGCRFERGLTVEHVGPAVPSLPHIEMTLTMLAEWGVPAATIGTATWRVEATPPKAYRMKVEPDLSNAAPFLAAAVVTGGEVTIPGWPPHTTQAGDLVRDLLVAMGADIDVVDGLCTARGTGRIRGLNVDLGSAGELTPVLTAVAALAGGPSRITGIAHLRGHETDRLAALATEINKLGGHVRELPDGVEIWPAPLHGGVFRTYDDHRLAQCAAVLGLVVPGVLIENIATTGKTLPDFVAMWTALLKGGRSR